MDLAYGASCKIIYLRFKNFNVNFILFTQVKYTLNILTDKPNFKSKSRLKRD